MMAECPTLVYLAEIPILHPPPSVCRKQKVRPTATPLGEMLKSLLNTHTAQRICAVSTKRKKLQNKPTFRAEKYFKAARFGPRGLTERPAVLQGLRPIGKVLPVYSTV